MRCVGLSLWRYERGNWRGFRSLGLVVRVTGWKVRDREGSRSELEMRWSSLLSNQ